MKLLKITFSATVIVGAFLVSNGNAQASGYCRPSPQLDFLGHSSCIGEVVEAPAKYCYCAPDKLCDELECYRAGGKPETIDNLNGAKKGESDSGLEE